MKLDSRSNRLPTVLSLTFVLALAAGQPGHADGGGGGGGSGSGGDSCPNGEVYDKRTGFCAKRQSGVLPDKDLAQYAVVLSKVKRYDEALDVLNTMQEPAAAPSLLSEQELPEYAMVLAKAKHYDAALEVLAALRNPDSAVALNYRGYVTRHLGRLDEGIGYYLKSVRLNPRYAQVREYLGEAYVIKGNLAKARYQLRKIKAICGNTECEEYEDLAKAIAGQPEEG